MSQQQRNVELIKQLNKAFLDHNDDLIDEIIHPDYIDHPMGFNGRDEYKTYEKTVGMAFTNMIRTLDHIIGYDDKVWFHFSVKATHTGKYRGIEPTNKDVTFRGSIIYQVTNNQIVAKISQVLDPSGMLVPLGVMSYHGFPS